MSEIRCKDCNAPLTWAAQKAQFGRAVQRGLSLDEAKEAQPRCGKCITVILKNVKPRKYTRAEAMLVGKRIR